MSSSVSFFSKPLKYYTLDQLKNLDIERTPEHVAIILDGNRRWGRSNNTPVTESHRSGADNLIDILKAGKELGIRFMTLFVFSTENWNRNKEEVAALMWLFEVYIRKQTPEMVQERIRFATIGDLTRFPLPVLDAISDAKEATKDCEEMEVIFAMNYGARDEMKRAVKKMLEEGLNKQLNVADITEEKIAKYLDTANYPDPLLLIRTGGEQRISNFMLWQLSYAEIYITKTFWPEFTPNHLLEALLEYQQRERRLGL